ncbi:cytochrome c oxidase subunit 3 [Longirhabdus pacifica]|uniref:cytochrome c oxidase subunit 3 n=1 Tax=Longirhabdus pacifica TaxID=2305227 RepID=UPI0010091455|nr:cytochrome c oxidase subunit 3 [Longirhabdus pacifica]
MSHASHEGENKIMHQPEKATLEGRNKVLGFWLFLGGETVLFGTLFATFIALRGESNGVLAKDLFDMTLVAIATFILLTSSLTSVLATQALHRGNAKQMINWLIVTVILGFSFLGLEIYEFYHYVHLGHTFSSSPFGSSFYALVGFHGAHVALGVAWITILIVQGMRKGITTYTAPKFYVAGLYWHFIDVVWVFIFTVVYLMGEVGF